MLVERNKKMASFSKEVSHWKEKEKEREKGRKRSEGAWHFNHQLPKLQKYHLLLVNTNKGCFRHFHIYCKVLISSFSPNQTHFASSNLTFFLLLLSLILYLFLTHVFYFYKFQTPPHKLNTSFKYQFNINK